MWCPPVDQCPPWTLLIAVINHLTGLQIHWLTIPFPIEIVVWWYTIFSDPTIYIHLHHLETVTCGYTSTVICAYSL